MVAVNVNDGDKLLLIQGRIRLQTLAFTVHRLDGKKAVIIMMANVQGSSWQTGFFELGLRDRNMQVRFCLKMVLKF